MTKEDLKKYADIVGAKSKSVLDKAGKAVSKFSDDSITKIEKTQLNSQIKKEISNLGELVYKKIWEENVGEISASDEEILAIVGKITELKIEVEKREEKLKSN